MTRYSRLGSLLLGLLACTGTLIGCGSDSSSSGGGAGAPPASAGAGGHAQGSAGAGASGAPGSAGASANGGSGAPGSAGGGQAGSTASSAGASGASTAGAGGTSSAGAAGANNAAGAGGGAGATKPSAGCGMAAGQALHAWVEQPKMTVKGVDRQWWVWLPNGYVPTKAYPVIFLFHGCGAADNVVPMQNATNDQAILVRGAGISANVCWDQSPDGVDMTFFDQMLAAVSAQRCVDTSHAFAVGYSSGSWLVNSLDCRRASVLRGAATVSGGYENSNCSGQIARIFIHDLNDPNNDISGSIKERDRLITANHCTTTTMPDDPSPCVRYQGCDAAYPIDWCQTTGKMHDRQDSLAPGAFWKFFSGL